LEGSLAVLEQGGAQLPLSDIEFANSALSFQVPLTSTVPLTLKRQ
jgi:hypothetical protein